MVDAVIKEWAYKEDVATLSDQAAHDIGITAAAGIASDASRHDHIHVLGAACVDNSTIANTAGVLSVKADGITSTQIADDAVGSEHIETLDAPLDCGQQQIQNMLVHIATQPAGILAGQIFMDTGKVYVCTAPAS